MAENEQLRAKNKRLSEAVLVLVDRIETNLPALKENEPVFESYKAATTDPLKKKKKKKKKAKKKAQRMKFTPPPTMEIFEPYREPIEFAEPAPQMTFRSRPSERKRYEAAPEIDSEPTEYFISPDLEPEEIDLLKSPTRMTARARQKVDVVDLHPQWKGGFERADTGSTQTYEASDESPVDIPDFEFPDEEPVVDVDYERKESLRAAMRRRVNRLRW